MILDHVGITVRRFAWARAFALHFDGSNIAAVCHAPE